MQKRDAGQETGRVRGLQSTDSNDFSFMYLQIPSIGLAEEVERDGVSLSRQGLTHMRYSGYPRNNSSNIVIVGHSIDYGRYIPPPFFYLSRVEEGDEIYLKYKGVQYVYEVVRNSVVESSEVGIEATISGKALITLYTCYPIFNPIYRYVVVGELVSIR